MASIETRLAQLEGAQTKTDHSRYTDAERAVKAAWLLKNGGPGADRIRELLAAADANGDEHHES